MEYRIEKLKEYLNKSLIDHDDKILTQNTLKLAHIYCIINNISSQKYGILIEKYILIKYNYKKNSPSKCNGDCVKNKKNFEIKTSLGGKFHNKFNYVQIRLTHSITNYIFIAYHLSTKNVDNEGELYIFKLSSENVKKLILLYGTYAHGTKKEYGNITELTLNDKNNIREYALRPSYGDECWNQFLKFRILENEL